MTSFVLGAIALLWFSAVVVASASGALALLPLPAIAALVAAGIAVPTAAWWLSPPLQRWTVALGQRRLMLLHVWRIPAALLFFAYGAAGALPPAFWILAGVGDFIAGVLALRESRRPPTIAGYRRFHRFGFADFVVAVGTGLSFTLMGDPRMAALAGLPLALIPLFGVGLSGAGHLVAFALLRREARQAEPREAGPAPAASGYFVP